MLQIYIRGDKESGFLDSTEDISLQMESITELFDEDLSQYDFSYPVEIPWTDNNRRLLNFAERIQNGNVLFPYWIVDVYDDGFPEIVQGKMTILEKIGNYTGTNGKFNVSIAGTKGLFGSIIKGKKLSDLFLGGTIDYSGQSSRDFATSVMKGEKPQYNYIAFAPVAIENFFDKTRPDYSNEFLFYDTVNYCMITGSGANDWIFGKPAYAVDAYGVPTHDSNGNFNFTGSAAGNSSYQYLDFRTIPFFQLKYVLKAIFTENGFAISGDMIDDTDFDDLFIFNNYALENYLILSTYTDTNTLIVPYNHLPNKTIIDFLKGIFMLLNIYPVFDGSNNSVKFQYRKNTLLNRTILPLTQNMVNDFDDTYDTTNQNQGYTLQRGWDGADQYHSDRVQDIVLQSDGRTYFVGNKQLVASVNTVADLSGVSIGRGLLTSDCVYVASENMFYSVANAATSPIKWDAFAERLNDFVSGKGQRSVAIPCGTLCTYIQLNLATGLYERKNQVACRQAGSCINNRGTRVQANFDLSVFYISKQNIGGNTIPVSYNHNNIGSNTPIEKYSLALWGEDGLAKNFHAKWQQIKDKAESIKTSIITDRKIMQDLQNNNTIEINSILFLCNKIERNIPQLGPMTVYLTPL